MDDFADLAARPDTSLDVVALSLAAELRPVDREGALARLDALGAEVENAVQGDSPQAEVEACRVVLGKRHGYRGKRRDYDHPDNSMLDLVLERRRGLPILLSVVWIEVARRAGIRLSGVGLPGHYVAGHFGADPPLLVDPFAAGVRLGDRLPRAIARTWSHHETAMRMLNNLVGSYTVRGDVGRAIRAAEMRLLLPVEVAARAALETELGALRARLN